MNQVVSRRQSSPRVKGREKGEVSPTRREGEDTKTAGRSIKVSKGAVF